MSFFKKLSQIAASAVTWVKAIFTKAEDLSNYIPYIVSVVNAIKNFNSSVTADVITELIEDAIPGTTDNKIIDKVRAWITDYFPTIALDLNLAETTIDEIKAATTTDAKLLIIVNALKNCTGLSRFQNYATIAAKILEAFSDGKLTVSEADSIIQAWYSTNSGTTTTASNVEAAVASIKAA